MKRLLLIHLLGFASGFANPGVFVPAGQPGPNPAFLLVTAGQPVQLDLVLNAPLPADNQCRTTLYALGGSLAAPLSEQTGRLAGLPEGRAGARASLTVAIPAARPGARFLLKTERLSPSPQLLGSVELRVPDPEIAAEVRALAAKRPLQIAGASEALRKFLARWRIPFNDSPAPAAGAAILTEEPGLAWPETGESPDALVEFEPGTTASTVFITARKSGSGWRIGVQLPLHQDLSSPDALAHFETILRFMQNLPTHPESP